MVCCVVLWCGAVWCVLFHVLGEKYGDSFLGSTHVHVHPGIPAEATYRDSPQMAHKSRALHADAAGQLGTLHEDESTTRGSCS